jgi:ferrous iron transport protein B
LSRELGVPAVGTSARTGEGLGELVRTVADVVGGRIATSPRLPAPPAGAQGLVDELVPAIEKLYPGLHSPRWIAYRLIEGDYRIRQALLSGELAALGGGATRPLPTPPCPYEMASP